MLDTLRLVFDSGLFVLIWMVQLLAYPSFEQYSNENLILWHKKYVTRIAIIVVPLMFGQLICTFIQLLQNIGFYETTSMILIVLVWAITFMVFVGLHNNISNQIKIQESVKDLIHKNWIRTIIWSMVFILTIAFKIKT